VIQEINNNLFSHLASPYVQHKIPSSGVIQCMQLQEAEQRSPVTYHHSIHGGMAKRAHI
jgi:hypothetical protein